jgi:quinoprotein glucose dehydrogenase
VALAALGAHAEPLIADGASPGARLAAATLRLAEGFRATPVASEPLLSNPVAICFDPEGRLYVAETHRIKHGTEDNRDHMDWLDDDLAARTVDDRRGYLRRRMGEGITWYTERSELVRRLIDSNSDGVYDQATTFAEGFNDIAAGAAAGVLWNRDRLLFTCIPELWELRDDDSDGVAEGRRALAEGFGVHCALFGHDLHGLCEGPDGLIYFSIGDRGFHVHTPDGVLSNPDSGAVLRCRPDGSGLEVFATGLRNPQELVFNEYGDLFTVDNNSDAGDRARIVHIVEGMQVGWRMSYQYLPDRGPFMQERIWETQNNEQPAAIVPPLAHLTDGPSGLVYYPGTGLPDDHNGGFFVCDFLGASGRSGVREFHLEPAGASYRLARDSWFVEGVLATDCDFGPDGNMYVVDWLEGWTGTGKGRIYRIETVDAASEAANRGTRETMASVANADAGELLRLLGNANMRVRLAAQNRLVELGGSVRPPLLALAHDGKAPQIARIHAIWALTTMADGDASQLQEFASLVRDEDAEIRNQAARRLGTARGDGAPGRIGELLAGLLADASPRVRCSAAIAVGKVRYSPALAGLLALARENNDADPVLRHAAAMGLAGSQTQDALVEAARGAGRAERLAIVVALGRLKSSRVSDLLADVDERVVLEAARAIWDTPLDHEAGASAYSRLAELVDNPRATCEPLLRRALAAALADGGPERLAAVIRCGSRSDLSPEVRALAWNTVSQWSAPSPRDPVHGSWRPPAPRSPEQTLATMQSMWPLIEQAASIDATGVVVAAELGVPEALRSLVAIVEDVESREAIRTRAIAALAGATETDVRTAIKAALASPDAAVRIAGRKLLANRFPVDAVMELRDVASSGSVAERQQAIQLLGTLANPLAEEILGQWLDRVAGGECPPELMLDVMTAAAAKESLAPRAKELTAAQAAQGPLAPFAMCAEGGDPTRGANVFATNTALSCRRCHSIKPDLVMVGPSLSDVGAKLSRAELLESIVQPNAKITEGFQTTSFMLDTGLAVSGILRREDATHAVLGDPEGKELVVELASVEERSAGLSAMPEGLTQHMSLQDLRDLVAYLATLRTPGSAQQPAVAGHGVGASSP